jgi:hypothetical protein
MFLGFLAGMFGFLGTIIAFPFAALSQVLLSYMFFVADLFAKIPLAGVSINSFPIFMLVISYVILIWFFVKLSSKQKSAPKLSVRSVAT